MRRPVVVFTGGGTAGHVFPALAVAAALQDLGYERDVIAFVGSRRGMEAGFVASAGYHITLLSGRGVKRELSLRAATATLSLAAAFVRALGMVLRSRPRAVVSVGGYASVPYGLAAALCGVPLVVVNVDAHAGAANRLLARVARVCAVATTASRLPRMVVTGAPVRAAVEAAAASDRTAARHALGIADDATFVLVTGGSLGAASLNAAAIDAARELAGRFDLVVLHVVGERNVDDVTARIARAPAGPGYRFVAFTDDLPALMRAADLVVSRAGAMTVAEIAAIGVASILVPLPGAPGDHQRQNAARLADAGAALLLDDDDLGTLADEVAMLLRQPGLLRRMGEAAAALGRPGASKEVARIVDSLVTGVPPAHQDR